MKTLLGFLMIANATLFFFGAIQHIGVTIGRFHEPRIIPAAMVETICGISLTWGAVIVLSRAVLPWNAPLVSNFIDSAVSCLVWPHLLLVGDPAQPAMIFITTSC